MTTMARRLAAALVAMFSIWSAALAGEVYGKVTEGGSAVGEGATLTAACGAKSYPPVKTDKTGSYRMVLNETGKCTMSVSYKGQSASLGIASYDDASQLDLILEMKDGKLSVRRK